MTDAPLCILNHKPESSLVRKFSRERKYDDFIAKVARIKELEKERSDLQGKIDIGEQKKDILQKLGDWVSGPLKLERAKDSAIHRFNQSAKVHSDAELAVYFKQLEQSKFHCFVIEHNLAAAFSPVEGFDSGEFALPYDEMIFEFQISGKRVMLVVCIVHGEVTVLPFIEVNGWWCGSKDTFIPDAAGGWKNNDDEAVFSDLLKLVWPQVRAVSIALDANLVFEDVVRAPTALNKAREKVGKPPLADYSIVRLLNRKKYLAFGGEGLAGPRRRLHFVRGHWRHYETHKTWIKWFLRGDIDLGVVDKEYRL